MIERVCGIAYGMLMAFGAALTGYWLRTGDVRAAWLISVVGLTVFLISGVAIVYRFT